MKNKKTLVAIAVLVAVLGVGGTIAYFGFTEVFPNTFRLSSGSTTFVETFESPNDWTPCTTTPKTVVVTNNSTFNIDVRARIQSQSWDDGRVYNDDDTYRTVSLDNTVRFDANGNFIERTDTSTPVDHSISAAVINFSNPNDWELKSDGWYYYKSSVATGGSTNSFIESVTFNCNAPIEYGSSKYHLNIEAETIQSDGRSESPDWL